MASRSQILSLGSGTSRDDLADTLEKIVISTGRNSGGRDSLMLADELEWDHDPNEPAEEASWPAPGSNLVRDLAEEVKIHYACRICEQRGSPSQFVFCRGCGPARRSKWPAHRSCLSRNRDHCPDADDGYDDDPDFPRCEEIDYKTVVYTTWLLDSSRVKREEVTSTHLDDLWSTWFGVPRNQPGPYPQLYIYPRLEALLSETTTKPTRQYPRVISFVGDTGSGKSTLIRAMIRMAAPRRRFDFRVPVPGVVDDEFDSTSSDVHVFADPVTISTEDPLFFVDSEGFSGSDNPVSRRVHSDASKDFLNKIGLGGVHGQTAYEQYWEHSETAMNEIDLQWGEIDFATYYPDKRGHVTPDTRNKVVKHVYPRLLYAFSDVICFVTNNTRAAHDILETLFAWAKDGHEKTLNQRVRPGLIIILNKMPPQQRVGDERSATERLLRSFEGSSRFTELRRKWHHRGKTINNAEELVLCYYDFFRVISIPTFNRDPTTTNQISVQIKGLYNEIRLLSDGIRNKRRSFNMDLDLPSLNAYVAKSATILGRDYRDSLDLHQVVGRDDGLPTSFGEHMTGVLWNMAKSRSLDDTEMVGGEAELLADIVPYLAACIVAQVRSAEPQHAQRRKEELEDETRRGLQWFRNRYWRCEAKDSFGRRCTNYLESHEKGHQFIHKARSRESYSSGNSYDDWDDDDSLEIGRYRDSYDADIFFEQLWSEMSRLKNQEDIHGRLASAARDCGVSKISGQRTCLSCLSKCPTNMLPCYPLQHGICENCIERSSQLEPGDSIAHIRACPLGCRFTVSPWTIRIKPRFAGARILSLDGGGIRGIVELVILSEIQKTVGLGIPIQDLFDLVIGTSTGGIIALGVFEKHWTLDHAKNLFRALAKDSFTLRPRLSVPVLSGMIEPFLDHRYTNSGIEGTLRENLGDDFLFGQSKRASPRSTSTTTIPPGDATKVGVITCVQGRNQTCLLANYSRDPRRQINKEGRKTFDYLHREDKQGDDFQIWQAARATSAAPMLFRPYRHIATDKSYIDGGVVRNNPVTLASNEAKRIWNSTKPPDIIVSVGTGIQVDADGQVVEVADEHVAHLKRLLPRGLRRKVELGLDMIRATLDCHLEWSNFKSTLNGTLNRNSHRLDVGLMRKPPNLDDVGGLVILQHESETYLSPSSKGVKYLDQQYPRANKHILAVARRLLACLFFISGRLPKDMSPGRYKKMLHCRLNPQSEGARALLALEPKFRLRETSANTRDIVKPVRHVTAAGFDRQKLSSQVMFDVSEGQYERLIEVQFPSRGPDWELWEPIGGF
ncbi:hypothetical protein B0T26DRAFT_704224 [Lasiosphaeria miniovina]|uniref:PNPLA domain-containing protein n=1 Tax=Lasiosphaeria miniovina TaxID=1954250 RepID=A0AA40AVS2_9PEZI|nr:uncharacterized protein B0T26DRAFT_704224 [Lasiosphaeria miniovina]KAK0722843.1 hypothetical protein B0T26DRAFT_704224 [Lasiosphaeria miniovina]